MLFIWFRLLLYRNSFPFGTCLTGGWAHLYRNPKDLPFLVGSSIQRVVCVEFASFLHLVPLLETDCLRTESGSFAALLKSVSSPATLVRGSLRALVRDHCTALFQALFCSALTVQFPHLPRDSTPSCSYLLLPATAFQLFAKPTDFIVIGIDLFVFVPHIMEGSWWLVLRSLLELAAPVTRGPLLYLILSLQVNAPSLFTSLPSGVTALLSSWRLTTHSFWIIVDFLLFYWNYL